ncbi:uncharacterized protein LOC143442479 [Arvicanthis niloticus]|uniref:uncharacterized protein LOC143442479 n=1 Tax=Arvicanthis niloticus TaxID=61156 RepID=UPI00403C7F41
MCLAVENIRGYSCSQLNSLWRAVLKETGSGKINRSSRPAPPPQWPGVRVAGRSAAVHVRRSRPAPVNNGSSFGIAGKLLLSFIEEVRIRCFQNKEGLRPIFKLGPRPGRVRRWPQPNNPGRRLAPPYASSRPAGHPDDPVTQRPATVGPHSFLPCSASPPEVLPAQLRCEYSPTPCSIAYSPTPVSRGSNMGTQLCNEKAQGQNGARGKKDHEETAQSVDTGSWGGGGTRVPKQALQFFFPQRRQLVTWVLILQIPLSEAGRHLQSSSNRHVGENVGDPFLSKAGFWAQPSHLCNQSRPTGLLAGSSRPHHTENVRWGRAEVGRQNSPSSDWTCSRSNGLAGF